MYLFDLVLETAMSLSLKSAKGGIKFNRRLVNNLKFADDIGLFARSGTELEDIMTQIDEASRRFNSTW